MYSSCHFFFLQLIFFASASHSTFFSARVVCRRKLCKLYTELSTFLVVFTAVRTTLSRAHSNSLAISHLLCHQIYFWRWKYFNDERKWTTSRAPRCQIEITSDRRRSEWWRQIIDWLISSAKKNFFYRFSRDLISSPQHNYRMTQVRFKELSKT